MNLYNLKWMKFKIFSCDIMAKRKKCAKKCARRKVGRPKGSKNKKGRKTGRGHKRGKGVAAMAGKAAVKYGPTIAKQTAKVLGPIILGAVADALKKKLKRKGGGMALLGTRR